MGEKRRGWLTRGAVVAGVLGITAVLVISFLPAMVQAGGAASSNHKLKFAKFGSLDCNGYSSIQKPLIHDEACTHPNGPAGEITDNGRYIGHDEPNIRFISNNPGSGNSVLFTANLPAGNVPAKGNASFQNYIAFWYGMALCDNQSYPQQTCINDSDSNTGLGNSALDAGSAVLELQFYAPGYPNFFNNVSCDLTHWCASLHINSLECSFTYAFCNPACTEPTNFAFLTLDGVPIGPPGPASATVATFDGTNPDVFHMNPGDKIVTSIHDTPTGLYTGVTDLTSGTSGFMIASSGNGFQSLNLTTCAPTSYAFHPEYDSAANGNIVPWAALQLGVSLDIETGHFEWADSDADDTFCGAAPGEGPSCLSTDFDFDGVPYTPNGWPSKIGVGTHHPSPVNLLPSGTGAFGPISGGLTYSVFELETDVGFTLSSTTSCNVLLPNQCGIPNKTLVSTYAGFYPYFSTSGCNVYFGNVHGSGIKTFGGVKGYGASQPSYIGPVAVYGTNGAYYTNSC